MLEEKKEKKNVNEAKDDELEKVNGGINFDCEMGGRIRWDDEDREHRNDNQN